MVYTYKLLIVSAQDMGLINVLVNVSPDA